MPDDHALDPASGLALIAEQRARVVASMHVDARLILGAWGLAWLIGFGLQWLAWGDDPLLDLPTAVVMTVFGALLVLAGVGSTWHVLRRSAGLAGTSAVQGAMYGWSWFFAFTGIGALGFALDRIGASGEVQVLVMTAASALVVGALYMAGGALWRERTQFVLGAWICLATAAAIVVGTPHMLLVMSLAGGGGMLVAAVVLGVREGRALTRP